MASRISALAFRAARATPASALRVAVPRTLPARPALVASRASVWRLPTARFNSQKAPEFAPAVVYSYKEVKELAQKPRPGTVIVDVREPGELAQTGFIPGAINIPYKSAPHALAMSEADFEDHFGFPKPSKDSELVFYCLGGVRCDYAQQIAGSLGYDRRGNYLGSWEDWVANESK
ncbi:Rhodanese-like domain-containing protein [Dipodascopsis tothii]|uniref:Rhodanese-like domain-containing protein n=1 Tax=Dipodascopsis tothii TaxID=44089 RepID=UPI0034CE94D0